jgi:histidyl-tRNA synthetase
VRVQQHAGGADGPGSMKSQFKKADGSGARHALVFGADELAPARSRSRRCATAPAAAAAAARRVAGWAGRLRA